MLDHAVPSNISPTSLLTVSCLLLLPSSLQLDPGNVHALFNRGISHEKRGDQRAAINDFTACIRLDPCNAVAYYNRAACYDAIGEFDKARQAGSRLLWVICWSGAALLFCITPPDACSVPAFFILSCIACHCHPAGGG